jgi:two-component system response regulator RegX3
MLSTISRLSPVKTLLPINRTDTSTGMRVALVEDDPSQADLLEHWLELAGHRCHRHDCGGALVRALTHESFDAVLLDWNLPDISGLEVLKHIRSGWQASLPVLLVTAHGREEDVVTALRQGADDCMVKPARRMELIARLEAITRRGRSLFKQPDILDLGSIKVDCQTRVVLRDNRKLDLTAKDFDLSALFLRNVGRLLSRTHIRGTVWGPSAAVASRTLDTHVSRVRHRLGLTPENGWRLAAMYRYGYRLEQLAVPTQHAPEQEPRSKT